MLPNKVVPYSKSLLPQFVVIKRKLLEGPKTIALLWEQCQESFVGIAEFMEVLESLYAIREIEVVNAEVFLDAKEN